MFKKIYIRPLLIKVHNYKLLLVRLFEKTVNRTTYEAFVRANLSRRNGNHPRFCHVDTAKYLNGY